MYEMIDTKFINPTIHGQTTRKKEFVPKVTIFFVSYACVSQPFFTRETLPWQKNPG
jgi:hypothetical protein